MAERFNRHGHVGVLHCVEINVRGWKRAFANDAYAREALYGLRECCDKYPAKLISYVVMPTHMHFVTNPRDGHINRFLAQFKPDVTLRVVEVARQQEAQRVLDWMAGDDQSWHLWQDSKHNLHLWSDWMIWQKINYIHNNPIRAGLAQYVDAYPYSSFCAMYGPEEKAIIPIDKEFWWDDLNLDDNESIK